MRGIRSACVRARARPPSSRRAVERGDALVGFDGQRGREDERAIGADLDVRGALRFLFGGENRADGDAAPSKSSQSLAAIDVGAGERHDEVRRRCERSIGSPAHSRVSTLMPY